MEALAKTTIPIFIKIILSPRKFINLKFYLRFQSQKGKNNKVLIWWIAGPFSIDNSFTKNLPENQGISSVSINSVSSSTTPEPTHQTSNAAAGEV